MKMRSELKDEFFLAIESHDVDRLSSLANRGFSFSKPIEGNPPLLHLAAMYTRSTRFSKCARFIQSHGGGISDKALAAVLCDDAPLLQNVICKEPRAVEYKRSLNCAFTPLIGVSLLHIAAEFSQLSVGKVLIEAGVDLEAKADTTIEGFNGHTAIFHTVNSHDNFSAPFLELLLVSGASCDLRLYGLIWGSGLDWETVLFDVTILSYTQAGLLPQFQRREEDIFANVVRICESTNRRVPSLANVPNRYLLNSNTLFWNGRRFDRKNEQN